MNPALIRLLQLTSPALPVGAYTYSQGLEWAAEAGTVKDEATALAWIGDCLEFGIARFEAVYLAHMLAAWTQSDTARLAQLDEEFIASRESAELRAETAQMGYSLARLLTDLGVFPTASLAAFSQPSFPLAWSCAASAWDVPVQGRRRRLSVGVGGESGDGCGEDRPARANGRPAHADGTGTTHPGAGGSGGRGQPRHHPQLPAGVCHCLQLPRNPIHETVQIMTHRSQPLRVGIGGPVGSGKTALTLALCQALRDRYKLAVVTNDIYTEEDAQFLVRNEALAPERIIGVETGGCPHTAIREDASINLEAVDRLNKRFPGLDVIFVESGGDNLAATFSPELSDLTIYVIDVAAGEKIPRKGGPGITKSDLLVINKIDLAPMVGASLEVMDRDTRRMRGERPFVFSNLKTGQGLADIIAFIQREGMLD